MNENKPIIVERFACNGDHSHWELINPLTGKILWTESGYDEISDIDFHNKISDWLKPMGYNLVYSNDANSVIREYHYIKDSIRIICVNDEDGYCYLTQNIYIDTHTFLIKSCKLQIGCNSSDLSDQINKMKYINGAIKNL